MSDSKDTTSNEELDATDDNNLGAKSLTNSESTARSEHVQPQGQPSKKSAKSGFLWFFTVINLLLLIGLGTAGYWAWLQWQDIENNKQDNSASVIAKIETTAAKIDSTESKLNALDGRLDKVTQETQAEKQNLQASIDNLVQEVLQNSNVTTGLASKLSELSGRRPADWLLAEADYLVRMAGRKLWLENDVKTAMMMLQSADARLQDLSDPSLFPVRKLIAQDIQTLHQVNPVSHSSIALAISGMIPQVENLTMTTIDIPASEDSNDAGELSDQVSDWRSNLTKVWRSIVQDFISVSRNEQPIEPYLADKQRWLIKEQIKYALTQAQSAVLADNETLYQASLQQAMAIIVEYYPLSSMPVEQFMGALQQLMSTPIATQYPSKLASSQALSDVLESRVTQSFNNKKTGEL